MPILQPADCLFPLAAEGSPVEHFATAGLLVLFCAIAAVVGLVWLIRHTIQTRQASGTAHRTGWLPVAGLCLAGFVGVVLIVRLFRSSSPVDDAVAVTSFVAPEPLPQHLLHDAGEVWRAVVDEQFEADIYPSARIATKALALQIAAHVEFRVLPKDAELSRITIGTSSGVDNEDQYAVVLAERLRAVFDVPTTIEPGRFVMPDSVDSPGHILVDLSYPRQMIEAVALAESRSPSAWENSSPGRAPEFTGSLKATIKGGRDTVVVMSQFVDKPWVARFDEFASSRPDRKLLLIRTPQFATGSQEAGLISDERAVDAVTELAMPLMRQNFGTDELSPDLKVHVRNTLRWLVNSGVFIEDRFVQKLKRPYGEVWRAAALVEVKPAQLETLKVEVHRVLRSQHQARTRSATFLGGGLAIFGVVTILCLFLNYVTKGYYRAKLAVGWLGGGAVVAAIVFLLANWFSSFEDGYQSATVAEPLLVSPDTREPAVSILEPLSVESPSGLSQPEPPTQPDPPKQADPPKTVPKTD